MTGCLYTGWIPGISGLLPRLLYDEAVKSMDSIDELNVFLGDRSVWSENASLDIIYHFVRGMEPGYFKKGKWIPRLGINTLTGAIIFEHPGNIGRCIVTPVNALELTGLAQETKISKVGCYAGIAGLATILKVAFIRYSKISDVEAVKILRGVLQNENVKYGSGDAISAVIKGKKNSNNAYMKAGLFAKDTVWLAGVATARL